MDAKASYIITFKNEPECDQTILNRPDDDCVRIDLHCIPAEIHETEAESITGLQLTDLNEHLTSICLYLEINDIMALYETGNRQLMKLLRRIHRHKLKTYQVAWWRMQRKINFFDNNRFNAIPWPLHISNLNVFTPMFNEQTDFVRSFIHVYCPLASLYKQSPSFTTTTYDLITRMFRLSEQKLCSDRIIEFVDVSYAALEGLKKLIFYDTKRITKTCKLEEQLAQARNKEFPTLLDYGECFDSFINSELNFVLQAKARNKLFENMMKTQSAIALTCFPRKFVTEGVLDRFRYITRLKLNIVNADDLKPLIKFIANHNRIQDLCLMGKRCDPDVIVPRHVFQPLKRCTALKRLSFRYCAFLDDRILRVVMSNLVNVRTFGSLYNTNVSEDGVVDALRLQRNIEWLELNGYRVRVVRGQVGFKMFYNVMIRIFAILTLILHILGLVSLFLMIQNYIKITYKL